VSGWDRFVRGFDPPTTPAREDEPDIFEELDALHDERVERGDSRYFPSGRDGLRRLVETPRARKLTGRDRR
jgi:hypothetical protein